MADDDMDASAPKRRRVSKKDAVSDEIAVPIEAVPAGVPEAAVEKKGRKKGLQSHGLNSRVYAPAILAIFQARYRPGASSVMFSLDDIRNAVDDLRANSATPEKISSRNPADVVYRMRSRTELPKEIRELGFHVLRSIGRGKYQFERAAAGIIEPPATTPIKIPDLTPLPVRRMLPETVAEMDEQAMLSVVSYCQILDHFTGMKTYRLRSHVRKSVPAIGQAELDAIDVGGDAGDDESEKVSVFPIEAKAVSDALNLVQVHNMVVYSSHYFPGMKVRPVAVKVDYQSVIHIMEFNTPKKAGEIRIVRSASYIINTSAAQLAAIRKTNVPKQ